MSERVTVDRHLYLTGDRCRVVEEGDPAGRWLHWAPGTQVPRDEFERLTRPVETVKLRAPAENKARRPAGNKRRS